MKQGIDIRLVITGGDIEDNTPRDEIENIFPPEFCDRVLVTSRLTQTELFNYFRAISTRGIFVMTSRYETLGITPLESSLCGLYTIVPDNDIVEVSRYFDKRDRFEPTISGLTTMIINIYQDKRYQSPSQKQMMDYTFSEQRFETEFIAAWKSIGLSIESYSHH
jgi:hypothetical protein